MNKPSSYRSGFALTSLIFIMVGILIVGGGAGYLYLNSLSEPNIDVTSEPADFVAGGAVKDTTENPEKSESNDSASSTQSSGIGSKIGGLLSGEKNCGNINMSEYLKDPLNYKPEVFSCYGQAFYDCSPAKMTFDKYEYKVEGKSGTNCVVSDSGAYDGIKKANRGPLTCSFPLEAPLAVPQPSTTKDDAFYKNVWRTISGATIFEGVNKILPTEFSATCNLK